MNFYEIVLIIVSTLSLLMGYYMGWRSGLKKGLEFGLALGKVSVLLSKGSQNADQP